MKARALFIAVALLSTAVGSFYAGTKWGRIAIIKDVIAHPAIAKAPESDSAQCSHTLLPSASDTTSFLESRYVEEKPASKLQVEIEEALAQETRVETLRTVARNLIQHVDQTELIDLATSTTFLKREDLDRMQDPTGYIERLFDVAIESPTPDLQDLKVVSLYFSKGVTADNQPSYPVEAFEASDSAIYATFSTPTPNESGRIIVRWFNNRENKMIAFNRYAIKAGEQNHYTWVQPRGGWRPGDYTVAIYNDDEALDLLATGNFYVVEAQ